MRKADRCPKCTGMLEDDGSCSCGYKVYRRPEPSTAPVPTHASHRLFPSAEKPMLEPFRSLHMRQWDGWHERWKARLEADADVRKSVLEPVDKGLRPLLVWGEGESYREFRKRVQEHVAKGD